jgi:hypothetical protein
VGEGVITSMTTCMTVLEPLTSDASQASDSNAQNSRIHSKLAWPVTEMP